MTSSIWTPHTKWETVQHRWIKLRKINYMLLFTIFSQYRLQAKKKPLKRFPSHSQKNFSSECYLSICLSILMLIILGLYSLLNGRNDVHEILTIQNALYKKKGCLGKYIHTVKKLWKWQIENKMTILHFTLVTQRESVARKKKSYCRSFSCSPRCGIERKTGN